MFKSLTEDSSVDFVDNMNQFNRSGFANKMFGDNCKIVRSGLFYLEKGNFWNGKATFVTPTKFMVAWGPNHTWIGEFREDALYSTLVEAPPEDPSTIQIALDEDPQHAEIYQPDDANNLQWITLTADGDGIIQGMAIMMAVGRPDILKRMIPVMFLSFFIQMLLVAEILKAGLSTGKEEDKTTAIVIAVCVTIFLCSVIQNSARSYSNFHQLVTRTKLRVGQEWAIILKVLVVLDFLVTCGCVLGGVACIASATSNFDAVLNALATTFILDVDNLLLSGFMSGNPETSFAIDIVDTGFSKITYKWFHTGFIEYPIIACLAGIVTAAVSTDSIF
eukprot:TRINITY_DN92288_c0_g1_i1.p1 TRINITY_DN92288_c0_g1~~TRINITY_DN92288_c0_g1_i1.p1  ORF type:complete len:333 (+),score=50.73 TRINITY_DN92288_c0_g1_i1:75-1073(+)